MAEERNDRSAPASHLVEVVRRSFERQELREEDCINVDGDWEGLERTKGRLADIARRKTSKE